MTDDETGYRVSQPLLVAAILRTLEKRFGVTQINNRQMDAVIKAATQIVDELAKPTVPATAGMGLWGWLRSDDTGLSSRYLASVLTGRHCLAERQQMADRDHPRDPSDFGRCVRLLDAAPELRPNLGRLADTAHGPVWNALAANWDELERLYREGLPVGTAPRLSERMKALGC